MKRGFLSAKGPNYLRGPMLTNNEIKDIIKVVKSLENGGLVLKRTTRKISSQEGGFISFLRPLMTAGVPLVSLVLTLATLSTCAAIQNMFWIRNDYIDNLKQINGKHQENGQII